MRDDSNMALLVPDSDRPSPKVWQPWYMEDGEPVGKETPTRLHRENRVRMRTNLQKSPKKPSSPRFHHPREDMEIASLPRYVHHRDNRVYIVSPEDTHYEDDGPLDMSMKRRSPPMAHSVSTLPTHAYTPPPPPLAHSYTSSPTHFHGPSPPPAHTALSASPPPYLRIPYTPTVSQVERPSVITCVTPPTHRYPEDFLPEKPSLPPPPPYSVATAHLRHQTLRPTVDPERMLRVPSCSRSISPPQEPTSRELRSRSSSPSDANGPQRQLVQGAGDVEIDEHFRRSLGKNYKKLFAHSSPPEEAQDSGDSVDEHFRKALGDTWLKIKEAKTEIPGRPSDTSSPSSLPPPVLERVSVTARSATPPEPIFKGTPDVSITRVPASSTAMSQIPRLGRPS